MTGHEQEIESTEVVTAENEDSWTLQPDTVEAAEPVAEEQTVEESVEVREEVEVAAPEESEAAAFERVDEGEDAPLETSVPAIENTDEAKEAKPKKSKKEKKEKKDKKSKKEKKEKKEKKSKKDRKHKEGDDDNTDGEFGGLKRSREEDEDELGNPSKYQRVSVSEEAPAPVIDYSSPTVKFELGLKEVRQRPQRVIASDPKINEMAAWLVSKMSEHRDADKGSLKTNQLPVGMINFCDTLRRIGKTKYMQDALVTHGILRQLGDWLTPLAKNTDVTLTVKKAVLEVLCDFVYEMDTSLDKSLHSVQKGGDDFMGVSFDDLEPTPLGKLVNNVAHNPNEPRDLKSMALSLMERWGRMIRKTSRDYANLSAEQANAPPPPKVPIYTTSDLRSQLSQTPQRVTRNARRIQNWPVRQATDFFYRPKGEQFDIRELTKERLKRVNLVNKDLEKRKEEAIRSQRTVPRASTISVEGSLATLPSGAW